MIDADNNSTMYNHNSRGMSHLDSKPPALPARLYRGARQATVLYIYAQYDRIKNLQHKSASCKKSDAQYRDACLHKSGKPSLSACQDYDTKERCDGQDQEKSDASITCNAQKRVRLKRGESQAIKDPASGTYAHTHEWHDRARRKLNNATRPCN